MIRMSVTCPVTVCDCGGVPVPVIVKSKKTYYLRAVGHYHIRASACKRPHSSSWGVVVEYMDRAQGPTGDILPQTLHVTHTNPSKSRYSPLTHNARLSAMESETDFVDMFWPTMSEPTIPLVMTYRQTVPKAITIARVVSMLS